MAKSGKTTFKGVADAALPFWAIFRLFWVSYGVLLQSRKWNRRFGNTAKYAILAVLTGLALMKLLRLLEAKKCSVSL